MDNDKRQRTLKRKAHGTKARDVGMREMKDQNLSSRL